MMERVSSQWTIFIRIALPTVWFTTFISIVILLGLTVRGTAQIFSNPLVWLVFLLILGTGFSFIHFVLWRFFRIDMDERYVYVSNYFKTYKYPFSDIESIRESKLLP